MFHKPSWKRNTKHILILSFLHYTTKDEEKFADWAPEFSGLSRTEDARLDSDMGAGGIYNINPMMWQELSMSMW